GTCTFVLVFDDGYFSEFGTFSITDWLGHTPPEVLAKTFDLPAETFADFPKKQVYIATGPVRPRYPRSQRRAWSTTRRSSIANSCSRKSPMCLPAAPCARYQSWNSRSRPP